MSDHMVAPLALLLRREGTDDGQESGPQSPFPVVDVETGPAKVPMLYAVGKIERPGGSVTDDHRDDGLEAGQRLTMTATPTDTRPRT